MLKARAGGLRRGVNFRATRCDDEHGQYDSLTERDRFHFLLMLQTGGVIKDLKLHPGRVVLIDKGIDAPRIAFAPDYSYIENGRLIYEDSKSRPMTTRENLIFKLWMHFGPAPLRITQRAGTGWSLKKEIHGRRIK